MDTSFMNQTAQTDYLPPKYIFLGALIVTSMTGLFVTFQLTKISQDPRSQANTQQITPTPNLCQQLRADFDHDCKVDFSDRNFLMNHYHSTTQEAMKADISGSQGQPDGKVDHWDYALLLQEWSEE